MFSVKVTFAGWYNNPLHHLMYVKTQDGKVWIVRKEHITRRNDDAVVRECYLIDPNDMPKEK